MKEGDVRVMITEGWSRAPKVENALDVRTNTNFNQSKLLNNTILKMGEIHNKKAEITVRK